MKTKTLKKAVSKDKWIWMPHPAHFCMAYDCQFFMATKVGKYIISTVGELFPDAPIREIYAQSRGIALEGKGDARRYDYMKKIGFEDIGFGRKYETMVFKAVKSETKGKHACACCPYQIESGSNIDGLNYNDSGSAYKGHLTMCAKWSKK